MKIRICLFILALLLTSPLFARDNTDIVIMKNGDRLTGEVKGLDAGVLYVSMSYILGTSSLDWSKVARLESKQLFIVKTQDGSVYKGTLNTAEAEGERPVKIEVVEAPQKQTAIERAQIVEMAETSDKFWRRFSGDVNFGTTYSKGNETVQYTLSSEVEYLRPRWSVGTAWSSNLSSSSGVTASTRNEITTTGRHLLPWDNWFYGGLGDFLQSSVQGIQLQNVRRRRYWALFEEHQPGDYRSSRRPGLAEYAVQPINALRLAKSWHRFDRGRCEVVQVQQNECGFRGGTLSGAD